MGKISLLNESSVMKLSWWRLAIAGGNIKVKILIENKLFVVKCSASVTVVGLEELLEVTFLYDDTHLGYGSLESSEIDFPWVGDVKKLEWPDEELFFRLVGCTLLWKLLL